MDRTYQPSLVALLPEDLIGTLEAAGQEKRFTDQQSIHSRGDSHAGLSIILTGHVRFGVFAEDGAFIQTGLLGEGHCFGEATLFARLPRAYDADALGDTRILQIGKAQFDRLLEDHPAFAKALLVTLTSRLYEALDVADDLRTLTLDARVAKQLLRIGQATGFRGDALPIRQIDLAYALGLSRVSVGKALMTLQNQGLIELGYGQINITDRRKLQVWIASRETTKRW